MSEARSVLQKLCRDLSLGARWSEPATFIETANIAGLTIHCCGLLVRDRDGAEVTGSAGSLTEVPAARAYYELLERTSVVEAIGAGADRYVVRDAAGRIVDSVNRDAVFPLTADPSDVVYSRSNGVAAASSWAKACQSAALELIERDRVLRSWYGALRPRPVPFGAWQPTASFSEIYALEAYAFDAPDVPEGGMSVRGVFVFPRTAEAPLSYGFAAGGTAAQALDGALRECLQRLGFLFGEPIPVAAPSFAPTAEYHQELFLQRSMHAALRAWLSGASAERVPRLAGPPDTFPDRYVDLTPPRLAGRVHVVRALPGEELPLVFGRGHPKVSGRLPASLAVHPIA